MDTTKQVTNNIPATPAAAATPRPSIKRTLNQTGNNTSFRSRRPGAAPSTGGKEGENKGGGRGPRRDGPRPERAKPEFDSKIINIRRVTRVSSGGRRFTFSVAIVAGNRKGQVGVGIGKGGDTASAIDKAMRDAKKHMITVTTTKNFSIPHFVEAKVSSASLFMMPVKGKGLVAGSAVRNVLELAGLKDINAKLLSGSKNKLNMARATIKALSMLKPVKFAKKEIKVENKEVK